MADYSNRHSCEVKRILGNLEFLEKENCTLKSEIVISRADYQEARSKIQDKEDLLQASIKVVIKVIQYLMKMLYVKCKENRSNRTI